MRAQDEPYAIIAEEGTRITDFDNRGNLVTLRYLSPGDQSPEEMELGDFCEIALGVSETIKKIFSPYSIAITVVLAFVGIYGIINFGDLAVDQINALGLSAIQAMGLGMGIVFIYLLMMWIGVLYESISFTRFLVHSTLSMVLTVTGLGIYLANLPILNSSIVTKAILVSLLLQAIIATISLKITQFLICRERTVRVFV